MGPYNIARKHDGMKSGLTVSGTETLDLAYRWYSEGDRPTRWVNRTLKLPRLEKPTSKHASVTL
jgi:hypothetical protein